MNKITLRVVAKIDARNFLKVERLPALKDAVIGIAYEIDLGDGAIASLETEEGLLDFLRCLRAPFQAKTSCEYCGDGAGAVGRDPQDWPALR